MSASALSVLQNADEMVIFISEPTVNESSKGFNDLPNELIQPIFDFFGSLEELRPLKLVCKRWKKLLANIAFCQELAAYKKMNEKYPGLRGDLNLLETRLIHTKDSLLKTINELASLEIVQTFECDFINDRAAKLDIQFFKKSAPEERPFVFRGVLRRALFCGNIPATNEYNMLKKTRKLTHISYTIETNLPVAGDFNNDGCLDGDIEKKINEGNSIIERRIDIQEVSRICSRPLCLIITLIACNALVYYSLIKFG